jgi:DNA helicase-2/ATP-dependent DNA helicase PcrA
MISYPSRFLRSISASLAQRFDTPRARVEGRQRYGGGVPSRDDDSWGASRWNTASGASAARRGAGPSGSHAARGVRETVNGASWAPPRASSEDAENESQDLPAFAVGERVRHPRFGSGAIVERTGAGRDTKVRVAFDDEEVGTKTLVILQARLERATD